MARPGERANARFFLDLPILMKSALWSARMNAAARTRILILGGGFGGLYTALNLQRLCKRDPGISITLISRHNYFVMTPLLFEAGSGVLEPRHAVSPIRLLLKRAQFMQAEIQQIDLDARQVTARFEGGELQHIEYDHLVLALGGITNTKAVAGSEHAQTFKTLADAINLRNHTIRRFEHADVEREADRRRAALTFVVIGAGFVGVELAGELSEFVENVARYYRNVDRKEIRLELIEAGPRIAPEFEESMSDYAASVLKRRGVNIRTSASVNRIEPNAIHFANGEVIRADTIVLATGVLPAPILASLPVEKTRKGAVAVDAMMRVKDRPGVWALGDCASIPSPSGKPYPPLAQHALREAKLLAANIVATIRGGEVRPFIYETIGLLTALGRYKGIGRIRKLRLRGFAAWWAWRSYYLFQMPRWSRRLRIMIDWTVALLFKNDVVELEMNRDFEHPSRDDSSASPPQN
jgi:NADH:quinone reductase (non-electrogenic)